MTQFSVIIPTYNRANYVVKAIESVFDQTFNNYEIIVVDDGSSDQTRDRLEPYFKQIRYFYQTNSGVSAARNSGIREAHGTWIAFLDSDDEWLRQYLDHQMESIRRFPEAVAHITNSIGISLQNEEQLDHFRVVGVDRKLKNAGQIYLSRPFRTIVSHVHWFLQPIVMHRATLLSSGIFNPRLSMAEDMDVVARLALKGPFTISSDVLVAIYRRQENIVNLSSQFLNRGIYTFKCFAKVFEDLLDMKELTFLERIALNKALNERWRVLGNLYLRSGKQQKARESYCKAMHCFPDAKAALKFLGTFLPEEASLLTMRKTDISPGDEADVQ